MGLRRQAAGLTAWTSTGEDGVHAQTLSAGVRMAERYQIADLVGETHRSRLWRADDDVLNRSVSVQVVSGDDPAAEAFLVAARRATAVEDSRFLRVLDAAYENGYAYVVREWASGVSLDNVLRAGPLSAARSISVVREVAEAVASAHAAGVQHRRIDPARTLVTNNGAVRLLGLATDQALHSPTEDVARSSEAGEQADVTALGALLYACLVARWPNARDVGRDIGLPAAPTEHGRLLRPRQVRAGVDRPTDAMCDRILSISPKHGAEPRLTAAEVARELAVLVPADEGAGSFAAPADGRDATLPHGALPLAPSADGPPPAVTTVPPPRTTQQTPVVGAGATGVAASAWTSPGTSTSHPTGHSTGTIPAGPRRRGRTVARVLIVSAVVLLVAMAAAVALLLVPRGGGEPVQESGQVRNDAAAEPPAALREIEITAAADFDPLGSGDENPDTVANTYDGDAATTWTTEDYYSELNAQKAGVGLLLDLGRPRDVARVDLQLVGRPSTVEVYGARAGTGAPPVRVDGLRLLGTAGRAGAEVSVPARPAVSTQYVVVWFTALPEVEAQTWRGSVAEITVRG